MSAVVAVIVMLLPLALLVAISRLVERNRRIRDEVISRQIAMTDTIHRDLGAVVAPTVTRTLFGRWRVLVPVPFERPALVSRVLEIARDTVAPLAALGGNAWEVVLVPQQPPPPREVPRVETLTRLSRAI